MRILINNKNVPVFFLTFALFAFCSPSLFASKTLTVKRVIEADVLELSNGKKVKLIGVTTPSVNDAQTNRTIASKYKLDPGTVQVYAFAARKFVQNVIEKQFIYLTYDDAYADREHKNAEGLTLAYAWFPIYYRDSRDHNDDFSNTLLGITSEDRLLNAEILRLGYGVAEKGGNYSKRKEFLSFEKTAQERGKGLWGSEDQAYDSQLERAQAAHIAATSDFVAPSVRKVGYNFATKALQSLIQINPNDYRAYYERAWLGAHEFYDKVSAQNIEDINKALSLAPNEPALHALKHYLLRLTGEYQNAAVAYDRAVSLTIELVADPLVTSAVRRGLKREALLLDLGEGPKMAGLLEDAYRAGLNEDHFLFFMARYKELERAGYSTQVKKVLDGMLAQGPFKKFYDKHQRMIFASSPHEIIYNTNYAKTARLDPEKALAYMNRKVSAS